ncbi:toxin [Bacillus lacus]|uniref:Toxin n=1 Tax=Metabacillus lacus TaxID=1983721 RepID=A0A7X2IWA0_9BACI|nr:toxin [Metabacillus lacus]MRX70905.1 toxin [Metabacillus lacus]
MKKWLLAALLLLVIPSVQYAKATPSGTPLYTYKFKSQQEAEYHWSLGELVLLPESTFKEKDVLEMVENLNKVDENILRLAADKGVKIKLFDGPITNESKLHDLKGKTPHGYEGTGLTWEDIPGLCENKYVYAKIGHSSYGMGHGSVALELHELGHAVDKYVFGQVRKQPAFLNIWKQESGIIFQNRAYFTSFPEEYFAEVFAMLYFSEDSRNVLRADAPLTYAFLLKLENDAALFAKQ